MMEILSQEQSRERINHWSFGTAFT